MMNLPLRARRDAGPRDAGSKPSGLGLRLLGGTSRGARLISALAGLLLASGCSMRSDIHFTSLMSEVPASSAIIVPPAGGPTVVAVLERRYLNGVSQEIALSTAAEGMGQNTFWISIVNDPEALTEVDDSLRIGRLDPVKIQAEIVNRLPGVDMRTSTYYVQNKYGPFGYAIGTSASRDLCLYGWQQIEPTENAIFMTGGTASVRVRICQTGATEAELLRIMYGYTIGAYYNSGAWNPYGEPAPPPPSLGQPDAPIYPLGLGTTSPSTPPSPPRVVTRTVVRAPAARRRSAPAQRPATQRQAPVENTGAPASGYPVVPLPPR
jgi:hypothetical protein